eukprot:327176-Amphidinium_carterae.3
MGLGSPRRLQLFQVVGVSTLRRVIACACPSPQLHRLWDCVHALSFLVTDGLKLWVNKLEAQRRIRELVHGRPKLSLHRLQCAVDKRWKMRDR